MSTKEITSKRDQYTLWQILGIWALASIPGALLFWLGLPILDRITDISVGYLVLIVTVIPYSGNSCWHF